MARHASPSAPAGREGGLLRREREADETPRRARAVAPDLHRAAVKLHERLHQGEAEPEPAPRPVEAPVRLHEGLEDVRQDVGGDADPVVPDPDERGPAWLALDPHLGAPAGVRELRGVPEDVPDDLAEARRVRVEGERDVGQLGHEGDAPGGEERRVVLQGAAHDLDEVHPLVQEVGSPLGDAGRVEEVVGEPGEMQHLSPEGGAGPRPARSPAGRDRGARARGEAGRAGSAARGRASR